MLGVAIRAQLGLATTCLDDPRLGNLTFDILIVLRLTIAFNGARFAMLAPAWGAIFRKVIRESRTLGGALMLLLKSSIISLTLPWYPWELLLRL